MKINNGRSLRLLKNIAKHNIISVNYTTRGIMQQHVLFEKLVEIKHAICLLHKISSGNLNITLPVHLGAILKRMKMNVQDQHGPISQGLQEM